MQNRKLTGQTASILELRDTKMGRRKSMAEFMYSKDSGGEQKYNLLKMSFEQFNFLKDTIEKKINELEIEIPDYEKKFDENKDRDENENYYKSIKSETTVGDQLRWFRYKIDSGKILLEELKTLSEAIKNPSYDSSIYKDIKD